MNVGNLSKVKVKVDGSKIVCIMNADALRCERKCLHHPGNS